MPQYLVQSNIKCQRKSLLCKMINDKFQSQYFSIFVHLRVFPTQHTMSEAIYALLCICGAFYLTFQYYSSSSGVGVAGVNLSTRNNRKREVIRGLDTGETTNSEAIIIIIFCIGNQCRAKVWAETFLSNVPPSSHIFAISVNVTKLKVPQQTAQKENEQ